MGVVCVCVRLTVCMDVCMHVRPALDRRLTVHCNISISRTRRAQARARASARAISSVHSAYQGFKVGMCLKPCVRKSAQGRSARGFSSFGLEQ